MIAGCVGMLWMLIIGFVRGVGEGFPVKNGVRIFGEQRLKQLNFMFVARWVEQDHGGRKKGWIGLIVDSFGCYAESHFYPGRCYYSDYKTAEDDFDVRPRSFPRDGPDFERCSNGDIVGR